MGLSENKNICLFWLARTIKKRHIFFMPISILFFIHSLHMQKSKIAFFQFPIDWAFATGKSLMFSPGHNG